MVTLLYIMFCVMLTVIAGLLWSLHNARKDSEQLLKELTTCQVALKDLMILRDYEAGNIELERVKERFGTSDSGIIDGIYEVIYADGSIDVAHAYAGTFYVYDPTAKDGDITIVSYKLKYPK